jgi:hypothetical protein
LYWTLKSYSGHKMYARFSVTEDILDADRYLASYAHYARRNARRCSCKFSFTCLRVRTKLSLSAEFNRTVQLKIYDPSLIDS